MANLYFPQLLSGALAQYPIQKGTAARTVKNVLPNGDMVLYSDPDGGRRVWQLSYTDLGSADIQALQAHFAACAGPFRAFTFIDPTDNVLVSSGELSAAAWNVSSLITVTAGIADPLGGNGAFQLTNTGEAVQEIAQTLSVPASYHYCFSVYAMASQPGQVVLNRRGPTAQQSSAVAIGPNWTRAVSNGQLADSGQQLTVAITVQPGQQITVFGLQLEAQTVPSSYRPTTKQGGVYSNAHWATEELTVSADGPGSYSTAFGIETAI